jgi:hypothetical protein
MEGEIMRVLFKLLTGLAVTVLPVCAARTAEAANSILIRVDTKLADQVSSEITEVLIFRDGTVVTTTTASSNSASTWCVSRDSGPADALGKLEAALVTYSVGLQHGPCFAESANQLTEFEQDFTWFGTSNRTSTFKVGMQFPSPCVDNSLLLASAVNEFIDKVISGQRACGPPSTLTLTEVP